MNGEALRQIADTTGGSFFEAVTADQLRKVYQDVGTSIGFVEEQREIAVWLIGFGLLFALVTAVTSLVWFSRLP